jgi:protein SCO1/2
MPVTRKWVPFGAPFGVPFGVAIGGLSVALALALVARTMRPRPPLPVYGQVPSFRLTDERGAPYTTESMLGHVTVADFVFTRCPTSCPRLTARMAELQARLARDGSNVRLVSFSVDPENDTPQVLSEYAARTHADPARWTFVTGALDDMTRAVVLGFKISAAKIARGASEYEVTHGNWFVVADRAGALRGYYSTEEASNFETLVADVERLEREKR